MTEKLQKIIKSLKEIVLVYLLQYATIFIISFIYIQKNQNQDLNSFLTTTGYAILMILDALIIVYLEGKPQRQEKAEKTNYFPIIYLTLSLALSLNMIIYLITPPQEIKTVALPLLILSTGIIGPTLEEYLFRYTFLNKLRTFLTTKQALIIETIIFAILHTGPYQIIYAFIIGLILSIIYIKTKNIKASIACHMVSNIIVLFTKKFDPIILTLGIIGTVLSLIILKKQSS